jgi:glycine/D-amino acid oxidase-like deaminating enzyme
MGQIAGFNVNPPLDFKHSISARGYLAHTEQDYLIVGSTYEHNVEDIRPDKEGLEKLKGKLKSILPKLKSRINLDRQWAGLRVSASDHKPIVGPHPSYHNLLLFTGLGSKGLLHGRYLANRLADYMDKGKEIPEAVNIERYKHLLE